MWMVYFLKVIYWYLSFSHCWKWKTVQRNIWYGSSVTVLSPHNCRHFSGISHEELWLPQCALWNTFLLLYSVRNHTEMVFTLQIVGFQVLFILTRFLWFFCLFVFLVNGLINYFWYFKFTDSTVSLSVFRNTIDHYIFFPCNHSFTAVDYKQI